MASRSEVFTKCFTPVEMKASYHVCYWKKHEFYFVLLETLRSVKILMNVERNLFSAAVRCSTASCHLSRPLYETMNNAWPCMQECEYGWCNYRAMTESHNCRSKQEAVMRKGRTAVTTLRFRFFLRHSTKKNSRT